VRTDRNEGVLGSSVCHFDLEFHVGRAAIRLPADPPQRAERQPEDVPKQKGFSDERRSRKHEAVRLQALFKKTVLHSYKKTDGSCLFLGCTENKREIRKVASPTRTSVENPFSKSKSYCLVKHCALS
jgi:hypothetical protein